MGPRVLAVLKQIQIGWRSAWDHFIRTACFTTCQLASSQYTHTHTHMYNTLSAKVLLTHSKDLVEKKLTSKPILPVVVAAEHHTNNVLPNIMHISLHCSQNYGALIGILPSKKERSQRVKDLTIRGNPSTHFLNH